MTSELKSINATIVTGIGIAIVVATLLFVAIPERLRDQRCRAAFAWSQAHGDSAFVVLMHPECGIGVRP